jgi:hypothetical protein
MTLPFEYELHGVPSLDCASMIDGKDMCYNHYKNAHRNERDVCVCNGDSEWVLMPYDKEGNQ